MVIAALGIHSSTVITWDLEALLELTGEGRNKSSLSQIYKYIWGIYP
jgi:hypothetical protein